MFVSCIDKIEAKPMEGEGVKNVLKRILVGPNEGWQSHVMRLFTIGKDGNTPRHKHPWPHINYVVSGKGILYLNGKEYEVEKNCVAYVPANAEHQYINTSDEDFVVICIVPKEGENL